MMSEEWSAPPQRIVEVVVRCAAIFASSHRSDNCVVMGVMARDAAGDRAPDAALRERRGRRESYA